MHGLIHIAGLLLGFAALLSFTHFAETDPSGDGRAVLPFVILAALAIIL